MFSRRHSLLLVATLCLAGTAVAAEEAKLTPEEMANFLLTAKVINSRQTEKGVTHPWRLTLTDGKITHDASFQSVDEYKPSMQFAGGSTEINFRDSYKYNIAAYELAKLVGLDNMMPVTVFRKWAGKSGSLTWWLPVKMDERDRLQKKLQPSDTEGWSKQINRMKVFSQLVYDTDRNATNMMIGENWEIWMIDFTRAFRQHGALENPKNLVRCDRQLLEKLRQLDDQELTKRTKGILTSSEIKAIMKRRDLIVAQFEGLIKEKGESEILY